MADQTAVLKVLVGAAGELDLDRICFAIAPKLPRGPGSKLRRQVIQCLGRLVSAGLALRTRCERSFGTAHACWTATAKGRAQVAAGAPVKSGPKGPFNGRRVLPDTLRQRAWTAFRVAKRATLAELAEVARRPDDGDGDDARVIDNLRKYLKALARAGIVSQLRVRQPGFAPSSPGFGRYALAKDLGAIAPIAGAMFVTDPNALARIPYPAKEAS
jgi:hypothetical protein